jgi:hypothetical protein
VETNEKKQNKQKPKTNKKEIKNQKKGLGCLSVRPAQTTSARPRSVSAVDSWLHRTISPGYQKKNEATLSSFIANGKDAAKSNFNERKRLT